MAQLVGFGFPLFFVLIFILMNKNKIATQRLTIYAVLIYVLSLACGIGSTILFGVGSIFSGVFFPLLFVVLFTVLAKNK